MFVLNGIVYANEKSENIQVVSVKPLDDMMMILTFSTGCLLYTSDAADEVFLV